MRLDRDRISTTAPWSTRIALFSLQLLAVVLILHRFAGLPTDLTMHLVTVAMIGAAAAIAIGLWSLVRVWQLGLSGATLSSLGIITGLAMLAWPLSYAPAYFGSPALSDVTTDALEPPRFDIIANQRQPGSNPLEAPDEVTAELLLGAYPDIQPIVTSLPVGEAFSRVREVVKRMEWRVVAEGAPQGTRQPGEIEAIEKTLIMGFTDDIAIRVSADGKRSRVDVRSAARYGRHDFGRNAERVRAFLTEVRSSLDASTNHDASEAVAAVSPPDGSGSADPVANPDTSQDGAQQGSQDAQVLKAPRQKQQKRRRSRKSSTGLR